jgi:hypothetical protein
MTKKELLEKVRQGSEDFVKSFKGLGPDALLESGVIGDWSIKDLIAHVSFWKAELIQVLFNAKHGTTPPFIGQTRDIDAMNAQFHQESQARTADQILADYHGVSKQLLRRIEELPEKDFGNPDRFPWLKNEPLERWVAVDSYEHEDEHAAQILSWRKKCS